MAGFELGSIIARIKADTTDFKKGIAEARSGAGGFAGKLGSVAKVAGVAFAAIGTAAVALGVAGIIKATNAAADFETKMANISTLISGDSTQAIGELKDGILELSRSVPKSADELGAAAYDILSAGVKGTANQMAVLKASSQLAVAGLGDTAGATDIMTSAINAFQLDAKDANKISDVLFKTVKNGKTTVDQMAQAFGATAPILAAAGISLEEFSAATAALTTTGMPASQAQNQLRQAVVSLTKPTAGMAELLKKAGYESGAAALEQDGLQKVMLKVKDAADGNQEALAGAWGSVEALSAATGLTGPVMGAFNDTLDDMTKGANSVDEAFAKQTQTFENSKKILGNAINEVFIRVGSALLPKLAEWAQFMADNLQPALEGVWSWVQENLLPALEALYEYINTNIVPVFQVLWEGLQALAEGFTTGKFAGDGFMGFMQNLGAYIGGVFNTVMGILKMAFDVLWPSIKALWNVIATQLLPSLMNLWSVLAPVLLPVLKVLAAIVGGVVVGALWLAINVIKIVISIFSALVQGIAWGIGLIRVYFATVWEIITLPFRLAYAFITKGWDGVMDVIRGIPGRITGMLGGVGEAIMAPFRKALDWIGEKMEWAKEQLNKLNPFSRNSPSLIDWINKGTDVIKDKYGTLYNAIGDMQPGGLNMSPTADLATGALNAAGFAKPVQATGPAGGDTYIIKMDGILAESPAAMRRLGGQLIERVNEEKRAQGKKEIGK